MADERTDPLEKIIEWFKGRSKDQLRALEHGGRLFWPETVKKLGAGGKLIETPCVLRCPTIAEKAQSSILANIQVQRRQSAELGLKVDPFTRDQAISYVGFDAYSELETSCLMSLCILFPEPPYAQMYRAEFITKEIPTASQYELYDRLDFYSRLEDIRLGEINDADFWALITNIAEVRNLSPLLVIAGSVRDSFMLRMAEELSRSATRQSSSTSLSTSIPESSPPTS